MPRRARMYLPDYPYHVVQRGNNREACFLNDQDHKYYLDLWAGCSARYSVAVHAYCLMTNHIHFLVTASDSSGISNTLKVVGSRYAYYFNKTYSRTGTLWEGRHKSSLIQRSRYLFNCYRYIELNPVRAKMVDHPLLYRWSSYGFNACGVGSWLTPHEDYLQLGVTPLQRQKAYKALFGGEIRNDELSFIRKSVSYCLPMADEFYKHHLEEKFSIRFGQMKRGRPKKKPK